MLIPIRLQWSPTMFTRWLVFHVASGQAFFTGAGCLIAAACLSELKKRRGVRVVRNVLVALGAALVFASATPLSPWVYLGLVVASLLWLAAEALDGRTPARIVLSWRIAVVVAWAAAMLVELPYHLSPTVPRLGRPILGVIGDSITAGVGDREVAAWPRILSDRRGVVVRDHSQAGAGVASALGLAASVASDERLLLLEIGGNDVLGGTSPARFEAGLEKLLSTVCRPDRVIVMLELPLPPTYNAFGRAQRRLARRFGAILVPRRVLLGVLLGRDSTLDTIHLSAEGHREMAEAVWDVLGSAYQRQARR